METTSLVEEPISAELVLVDGELARRARAELPDSPWVLPVLAEVQEAEAAQPTELVAERSPRPLPRVATRPRRRSFKRHVAATVASGLGLLVFAVLVASAADLLRKDDLTFSTTPVPSAAAPKSKQSAVGARAEANRRARSEERVRRQATRSEKRTSVKPKGAKPVQRSRPRSPVPPKRSAPKPRALTLTQRVFKWRRDAAAIYYQFYVQRGATTVYQARTLKLKAALPAHLKLKPGTYRVLVRPAIPSDAGVILGDPLIAKKLRV